MLRKTKLSRMMLLVNVPLAIYFLTPNALWAASRGKPAVEPNSSNSVKLKNPMNRIIKLQRDVDFDIPEYDIKVTYVGLEKSESGQKVVLLRINYIEGDTYDGRMVTIGKTASQPNPRNYNLNQADLLSSANRLYRTYRNCDGTIRGKVHKRGLAIVDLQYGYTDFVCRDRFYEQCFLDGSFDTYYEEFCDYGEVPFLPGQSKSTTNFRITLMTVDKESARISISYIGRGIYKPPYLINK